MATYDSAYLLAMFNRLAGRPASGDILTDPEKYVLLSEGQQRVIATLAGRCPESLYPKGAIPTMTTVDNKVFTFGTDSEGHAVFPFGKARIFRTLASVPDYPMEEGIDYIDEGTQIRIPNDRTEASTLYWYGISTPADIDGSAQPSLYPVAARELIVFEAVLALSRQGDRNEALGKAMLEALREGYDRWLLVWRTQFSSGGALSAPSGLKLAMLTDRSGP